ncbi:MAG: hypothetical protein FH758_14025 [Firmicutes bacterium]|nr:hypothetical protein [Bacillota bacterium]
MDQNYENILVEADTSSLEDVKHAFDNGAQGIGILRTEHIALCSEEGQYNYYRKVLEEADGKPVTIRTFVGSDEKATGQWGIRYSMSNPEILLRQLRAILKASASGSVSIVFPGITVIEEFQWAKKQVDLAKRNLQEKEYNNHVPLGIMVEIPTVVICLEMFIHEVNFYIIDSDILIRNLVAADDLDSIPGDLTNPLHPVLLRTINQFIRGKLGKKPSASVCGGLVETNYAVPFLKGVGVRSIAVAPEEISDKQRLAEKLDKENSMKIASKTLALSSTVRIEKYISTALDKLN